jgi:hypothetical protein
VIKSYKILTDSYEDAKLHHDEFKVRIIGTGVFTTVSKFRINVPYKGHFIAVDNQFGNPVLGKVSMKIEKGIISEFEIHSRNHLKNLFVRKKKYFEIECSNDQFKKYLEEALFESGMEEIAKENLFEPSIKIERIEGAQFVNTEYHLQLKDKIGAVKALIYFYKEIVNGL